MNTGKQQEMQLTATILSGQVLKKRDRKRRGPTPKLYKQTNGLGQKGHWSIRMNVQKKRTYFSTGTEDHALASARAQTALNMRDEGRSAKDIRDYLSSLGPGEELLAHFSQLLQTRHVPKPGELLVGAVMAAFLNFQLPPYCEPISARARVNYRSAFYAIVRAALCRTLPCERAVVAKMPVEVLDMMPFSWMSPNTANVVLRQSAHGAKGTAQAARENTAATKIQTIKGMFTYEFAAYLANRNQSLPTGFVASFHQVKVKRPPATGYRAIREEDITRIIHVVRRAVKCGKPGALPLVLALFAGLTVGDIRAARPDWLTASGTLAPPVQRGERPRVIPLPAGIARWLGTQPLFRPGAENISRTAHHRAATDACQLLRKLGLPQWSRPLQQLRHLGVLHMGDRNKPAVIAAIGATSPANLNKFFTKASPHARVDRRLRALAVTIGRLAPKTIYPSIP